MEKFLRFIVAFVVETFTMFSKYFIVLMVVLFDGVLFGYPIMWINNNVLSKLYSVPIIGYWDGVGMIFLLKIIIILIKFTNFNNQEEINNK